MTQIPDLIARTARDFGPRPALGIRRGLRTEIWSYQDVERGMGVAAQHLSARGVRPGDRVMMLAPNSPELVLALLGVWAAGAVLVPIDLRTPTDVMDRVAERTDPRLLLTDADVTLAGVPSVRLADLAPRDALAARPPLVRASERGTRGEEYQAALQPDDARSKGEGVPDGLAEIVFTSGTTGAPKGVMLTHRNILASAASARAAVPIAVGERMLSLLPLSHMMEQTAGLLAALSSGATVFYATSRRSSALLAAFQRHRIGMLIGVPEILALLMGGIEREVDRSGRRAAWNALNAVASRLPLPARPALFPAVHRRLGGHFRMALCGGAPLAEDVQAAWERLGVRIVQGYGATECAPVIASNRPGRRVPGTVGWPVPTVEVRLADDGEVLVRGPNVTPGYWRDPEATAASFTGDWYRTGDLGERGPHRSLRLRGRKKEMIVLSDGRNVFPDDVEPAVRAEAAIRDCAVVGRPRGRGVEVHAVLIPAAQGTADDDLAAAIRRANGQLGPHQQIGGWSRWPDPDFPRTPSLKVRRGEVLTAVVTREAAPATAPPAVPAGLDARIVALLARATGTPAERLRPDSDLHLDLGLDSLGRVELAVLFEEELGVSLPDEKVAELRTVADLIAALQQPAEPVAPAPLPAWPRWQTVRLVRSAVQSAALFPLLRAICRPSVVVGREHLDAIDGPALLIANHASHIDGLAVLASLAPRRRARTAVAAAADYFFVDRRLAALVSVALGAYPFHRSGPVAASLAHSGDLADDGYSILVFPEGTRSVDGMLAPFKPGIGLLARELGLPVVPIWLDGLHRVLPKGRTIPRPGGVRVHIGAPLAVDPRLTNTEAASLLEAALRALGAAAREDGRRSPPARQAKTAEPAR